jgi:2-oxoisovalerate dehydrogenase E2 component (dihydrolipoyl transacylase)
VAESMPMPKLAETTDLYVVLDWLVEVGHRVAVGDPVANVETDKITVEVPSTLTGTVAELVAELGVDIRAGDTLLIIEAE